MTKNDTKVTMPELCQIETAQSGGSLRRPGFLYVPMRIIQKVHTWGSKHTAGGEVEPQLAAPRSQSQIVSKSASQAVLSPNAPLNLEVGELVEVKSLEEILQSLDGKGKLHGLVFTPEMRKHCGKQYRVFKRLELMFDEYHKTQRRVKNTVLLESVVCGGAGLGCDRCCFLYWREAWLRRVPA